MKRTAIYLLFALMLTLFVNANTADYGYYDADLDGRVEVSDVLLTLDNGFKNPSDGEYLLHVLRVLKATVVTECVGATVVSVDYNCGTVLISTEKDTNISAPLSILGVYGESDEANLDSMPLTVSVGTHDKKVYAALLGERPAVEDANSKPISIKKLNTVAEEGSHAEDDIESAYLERSYRESLELTSASTGYFRYDYMYYPRIKKINDNLYLMLSMYGQIGTTLYYSTSEDCINWSAPAFLYRSIDGDLTYSGGSLDGVVDKFCAVNADATVLDNGDIFCVYFMRPNKTDGRIEYPDLSGIFAVRGTVGKDNKITWGEHKKVYTGTGWEPCVYQREDGRIEIYWTSDTYYMRKYGWDDNNRATCCAMIWSDDGGETFTPNVTAGDTNYYQGFGVFSQYLGTKVHTAQPSLGKLPWFGGQMPAVTGLYNGKTLIAAEVKTLSPTKFTIALNTSSDGGEWTENLQNGKTVEGSDVSDNFVGAGPYLATFPSGEVYLSYHNNSTKLFYGRMISPDGSYVSDREFLTVPSGYGMWASCDLISSHEVVTAAQKLDKETSVSGIAVEHSYLNHRINANKYAVEVDGYTNDWGINNDAFFVGSESQAQSSLQIAHDKDNLYFLISRFDNVITSTDCSVIKLSLGGERYTVTVDVSGEYKVLNDNDEIAEGSGVCNIYGSIDDESDSDEGLLIEVCIPRKYLGAESATALSLAYEIVNSDGDGKITDAFASDDINTWPKVVLE